MSTVAAPTGHVAADDRSLATKAVSATMFSPYRYLMLFIPPLVTLLGMYMRGLWLLMTPLVMYAVVPILDIVIPADHTNPTAEDRRVLEQARVFRAITYAWAPLQCGLVLLGCTIAPECAFLELLGLILAVSVCTGGLGITVSHELMHKHSKFEQFLAKFILLHVCYMHFFIEHLMGHHKRVATPEDPATARLGENVYQFVPRSIVQSFQSAWHLECKRLRDAGLPVLSVQNQMLWFAALPLMLLAMATTLYGPRSSIFFLLQSLFAVSLLEIVNFIEHYGLQRKQTAPGKYERVNPHHSWNSASVITSSLTLNLPRHADHHTFAAKRYQTLESVPFSPQLPTGYVGMMLLALVPPAFRRVMDPRVHAYNALVLQSDVAPAGSDKNEGQTVHQVLVDLQHEFPPIDRNWLVQNVLYLAASLLEMIASLLYALGAHFSNYPPAYLLMRLSRHVVWLSSYLLVLSASKND